MLRRVTMRLAHLMRQCTRAKTQIHSLPHRDLLPRPLASDLRGNTVQISPPFITTDDEVRQLVAAIDTVVSAKEAE
jgi:adenosylmethionine-8-amino-7-oxononanoate aminotransferase